MTDAEFMSTDIEVLLASMSLDQINARLTAIINTALAEIPSDDRVMRSLVRSKRIPAGPIRCLKCQPDETFDGWNPPGSTHCLRCYMPLNKRSQRTSKDAERLAEVLSRSRGFR